MKFKFMIAAVVLGTMAFGHDTSKHGKGLIPPSQKERDHIKKNWQKVSYIHPNKVGAARIRIEHAQRGLEAPTFEVALQDAQEFGTPPGGQIDSSVVIPSSVDNSKLPSFPPIGDQGNEGSCLAWASTYYQATHETGLINGRNNKNSFTNVFSPKWTYNMTNGGGDNGSMITDAYGVLSQNGAASLVQFPYDGNYLAWDMNSQDWIGALSNRLGTPKFIPGLDGDISRIKSALNNGHILTFGTYVDSWVFTTVGDEPNSSNPYAGQLAASWMNGTNGGHMMTIVGYNDDIWIDVNGNGQVDAGETGAFLIANSWSSAWGNNGFVWVSYDAFRATSEVPNGPSEGRVALADASDSCGILATAKAAHYSPSLIAEFQLSQTDRSQIKVAVGASDATKNFPTRYFFSGALVNQGGALDFSGAMVSMPQSGTFCLDLTDLIPSAAKYYFILRDDAEGSPTGLNSLSLVDLAHGNTIMASGVPQTVDNSKIMLEFDYAFPETQAVQAAQKASGITSPTNHQILRGVAPFVFSAGKTVASVDFYIDRMLVGSETEAPYCMLIDTTKFSNGTHAFSAVIHPVDGTPFRSRVRAIIQN